MFAQANWVITDSGNGMWPVRNYAIIWTNVGLLLTLPLGTIKFETIFMDKNEFENVVCKMAIILFRPPYIDNQALCHAMGLSINIFKD